MSRQKQLIIILFLIIIAGLILFFVFRENSHQKQGRNISGDSSAINTSPPSNRIPHGTSADEYSIPKQTKISNCQANGPLPDPDCTPGAIFQNVTVEQVCAPGYARTVRDVPESIKRKVYAEYGIITHEQGQYEVDHLISLELGGSNDISNLFPEAAKPIPGYHEKDSIENLLHEKVCHREMTLPDAQRIIRTNWTCMLVSRCS